MIGRYDGEAVCQTKVKMSPHFAKVKMSPSACFFNIGYDSLYGTGGDADDRDVIGVVFTTPNLLAIESRQQISRGFKGAAPLF